jgi:tetratricopeptide (TPR) repeat protein
MNILRRIVAVSLLVGTSTALADTVFTSVGPLNNVQIVGIEGSSLRYITPTGAETTRDLSAIQRLQIDTEPAFNQAEEAYAAGQWDKATGGYEKTIRATNKPWLKQWSGLRLLEAAEKSGNFAAATTAWIEVVQSNPAAAQGRQPKLPEGTSTFLDTAAADIEKALQGRLDDKQKAELLKFVLNIYQRKNDTAKAISAAERLSKLPGVDADPALLGDLKLSLARIAFDQKNYPKARQEIDSVRANLTTPEQQSQALYLLAEVDRATAGEDKNKLQDAALAYMRVVAHFPRGEHAPDALLKTGGILEKLGQTKEAMALYQQAATDYPTSKAKENVERLKKAGT